MEISFPEQIEGNRNGKIRRMMVKKNVLVLAASIIVIITAVFLFLTGREKTVSKDIVIKVSETSTSPNDWDMVKKLTGRDILKEEGVRLEQIPGNSGKVPPFQALLTGQFDVESRAWAGWPNAVSRGMKIKAVYASNSITRALTGRSGMLVLESSGIHTIEDLKGKTIAVNVLGLAGEYVIKMLLKKHGISPDQVQFLLVPVENQEQVLRTKQVDAAVGTMNGGTWFDLALERGGVRIIPGTGSLEINNGKEASSMGAGFREDFIRSHPDAVRRYVTAVVKAKQIIWDAFKKDPGYVRKIHAGIAAEKGGNPVLAKYYLPLRPETTFIKDEDVQFWIDILVTVGQLKPGQIKPADIYTNEFSPFYKGLSGEENAKNKKIIIEAAKN